MAGVRRPPTSPQERTEKPTFDDTGRSLSVVGVDHETSENQNAHAALQESHERLQAVLRTSPDAGYRWNLLTERYDYMSPVIERLTGLSAEEMCVLSLDEMLARIHPEDRPRVVFEVERILVGGRAILEYRFQHKDGQYRWVADHTDVLTDQDGRPLYRVGFIRDITERERLEEASCASAIVGRSALAPYLADPERGWTAFKTAENGYRYTAWIPRIAGVILVVGLAALLYRAFPGHQISSGPPAASDAARRLSAENATLRLANGDLQEKLEAVTRERNTLQGKARRLQRQMAQFGKSSTRIASATPSPGAPSPPTVPAPRAVTMAGLRLRQHTAATPQPVAPDPPSYR